MKYKQISNILKNSKKRDIKNGYYLIFGVLFVIGMLTINSDIPYIERICSIFLGLYLLLGVYVGFVYDIPLFNKYAWWHSRENIEMGIFDLIMSIVVFFLALYCIFSGAKL